MNKIISMLYHGNLNPFADVKLGKEGRELEFKCNDKREKYRNCLNQHEAEVFDNLIDLYESLEEEYYLLYYSGGIKHGARLVISLFGKKKIDEKSSFIEEIFYGKICSAEQFELTSDNEKSIAFYDALEQYEENMLKENKAIYDECMKLSNRISDMYYEEYYANGLICGLLIFTELYRN